MARTPTATALNSKNSAKLMLLLAALLLLLISLLPSSLFAPNLNLKEAEETITIVMPPTEIFGVKIQKNVPQSRLDELGVTAWPKWSSEAREIAWTFKSKETMYILEGKVRVYVDGHEGSFEIGGGDLVVFPKGMNIIFRVLQSVTKHYSLD